MRILYHHRTQGKGVEGIHIRSITTALCDAGQEVFLVSPPGCDPFREENTAGRGRMGSFLTEISRKLPEITFEWMEIAYNLPILFKLVHAVRKNRIDVIYERYYLFSLASSLVAGWYGIPIIYEINDSSFVRRLRRLRLIGLAQFIEKIVFRRAQKLITVSNVFRNILLANGIPFEKTMVIHNGIDLDIFSPEIGPSNMINLPSHQIVIGFVGLFVKWIGLIGFLKTFKILNLKHPNTHLLLVGSGPEENNVRKAIEFLDLDKNVTITGQIPHKKVPFYISRMDICVIPKHERYTSPVKLFEYMSMGKGVVVPAYPSLREIIQDGVNGVMFDPDSDNGILKKMDGLIRNPELLAKLGKNAHQTVIENHTWDHNATRIIQQMRILTDN